MGWFRSAWRRAWAALAFALIVASSVACSRGATHARVHVDVLEDASHALAYADVVASGRFQPINPARTNIGYSSSAFWLRAIVDIDDDDATTWLLEPGRLPSRVELYGGQGPPRRSGVAVPASERDGRGRAVAFRVDFVPHAHQTFFLRIESEDTIDVAVRLTDAEAFADRERVENLLTGAYYGAVVGIVLYNFFLFVSTRDRSYLLYVIFQTSLIVAQASIDKYGQDYLWARWPWFSQRSDEVIGAVVVFNAVRFAAAFLETRTRWPKLHVAMALVGGGSLVLSAVALVKDNDAVKVGLAVWFLAAMALLITAGILGMRERVPNAPFFLAAWGIFLLGVLVQVTSGVGILQISGAMAVGALKIGSVAEATLLSLGLGNRIRLLRDAQQRAQATLLDERTEHARSLEARVDARTRELSEALTDLREAQDMLVRQERLATLGRIAAGVGHEVGNPLNFVSGGAAELDAHLGTLEARPGDARALGEARRALRLVSSGSDRIKKVVANFRRYVSSGDVATAPTDLVAELAATLDLTADLCERCGVKVVRAIEPLPLVPARAGEIEQIFMNVIVNACHAMNAGGTLTVSTKALASTVEIRFADDGPGVPASRRPTLFDPFARGDVGGGTGLGLFVSREIAARHGGELRLEESEAGATFVVTLPRAPAT